ncbi:hypothetical protein H6P81_011588 [Aristolochia fimbriata]|uniref:Uncharacterized protein n=1 Tax=Aristolochia fimbriata TaxID=158543 RepID=A0AAV7EWG7_ARIFI|nr:hypothetical protein H6P81_011588 [Aristolochia fimbriata]
MADIALLVVEEFERRRNLEEQAGLKGESIFSSSLFPFKISKINESAAVKIRMEKLEFGRGVEPKSSVAKAALNGFFSA